jgi:hypothetical protein
MGAEQVNDRRGPACGVDGVRIRSPRLDWKKITPERIP